MLQDDIDWFKESCLTTLPRIYVYYVSLNAPFHFKQTKAEIKTISYT
jgi:hypothetical protein